MNESMDELSIEINSSVDNSTKKIQDLITSLESLETSLKNVVKQSENLSVLKKNIGNVKTSSSGSSISKTKTKTFKSERSQLADLGVDLKQYKLFSSIEDTNSQLLKYKNNMGQVVTITRKFTDDASRRTGKRLSDVKVKFSQTNNAMKQHVDLWGSIKNSMGWFLGTAKLVISAVKNIAKRLADTVTKASQYEEALNLFTVTMGENFEKADAFVKKFSDALYLDPKNVMQYMGSFNSLIEGLGVGSENALLMSENMTQLVYDLASFKNLSFQTAYEKLMSGISGELEPLRNVGVALSQNTLQELANSLGIKQRVAEMNEAQKAQLRYIQIMKASTEWQTDMGRTLLQPANAIRVMKEQISLLAQAIGRIFIPIVMNLMPYVVALTQVLTEFANKVAKFFNYELKENNNSAMGKLETQIGGIGKEAEKTTKKLNTMLAPFDELNVVQNKMEGSGSGALGSRGEELGTALPFYDALAKLDENFGKSVENAKEKLQEILNIVLMIGSGLLAWKVSSWITDLGMPVAGSLFGSEVSTMTNGSLLLKKLKIFAGVSLMVISGGLLIEGINEEDFMQSIGKKLGSVVTGGASTWMLTKNVTLTLAVTAVSTTIGAIDAIKDLIEIKPTLEELESVPVLGPLISAGRFIGKKAHDIFGNSFYDFGVFISDSIISGLGAVGSLLGLNDKPITTSKGSSGKEHGGAGREFKTEIESNMKSAGKTFAEGTDYITSLAERSKSTLIGLSTDLVNTINGNTSDSMSFNNNVITTTLNDTQSKISSFFGTTTQTTTTAYTEQQNALNQNLANQKQLLVSTIPIQTELWRTLSTNGKNAFITGVGGIGLATQNKIKSELNTLSSNGSLTSQIKPAFSKIGGTLGGTLSSSIKLDKKTVASNIQKGLTGIKFVDKVLGVTKQLFQDFQITGYASGGYPESGQFFMARENGIPEMVGRIGSKTAVANNDQITTAITNAIIQGLSGYGNNNTPVAVYIGNDKIYEGYGQHIDSENDRYGTNVVHV